MDNQLSQEKSPFQNEYDSIMLKPEIDHNAALEFFSKLFDNYTSDDGVCNLWKILWEAENEGIRFGLGLDTDGFQEFFGVEYSKDSKLIKK